MHTVESETLVCQNHPYASEILEHQLVNLTEPSFCKG
jgi:hypothetical protein